LVLIANFRIIEKKIVNSSDLTTTYDTFKQRLAYIDAEKNRY